MANAIGKSNCEFALSQSRKSWGVNDLYVLEWRMGAKRTGKISHNKEEFCFIREMARRMKYLF